jgi:hypothetical protein
MVAFAYNTAVHEVTKISPFNNVYNRNPTLPLDLALLPPTTCEEALEIAKKIYNVRKDVNERIEKYQTKQKARYDTGRAITNYEPNQLVKVYVPIRKIGKSDKLLCRWFGPRKIIKRLSENTYLVSYKKENKTIEDKFNISKIKPYHLPKLC